MAGEVRTAGCAFGGDFSEDSMALISRNLNPNRSWALDVFRGVILAGMILVSNPGGSSIYAPLEHAAWNVFPSFAFAIGAALVYALDARRTRSTWRGLGLLDWILPVLVVIKYAAKLTTQTDTFRHAADPPLGGYDIFFAVLLLLLVVLPRLERRAVNRGGGLSLQVMHHGFLIFALGFIWDFNAANAGGFRTLAVLQRLGIVYLFAGLILLKTSRRGQIAWAAALLAIYWVLMKSVPVPGYGAGVLTMEGNLAGYIDRLIIGPSHMYIPGPPTSWDPEGLLGAIPAVATALLGALAGGWMRAEKKIGATMAGLLIPGALLTIAGLALAPWFPVNKNLWSPTYVLLAGGIDFVLLAACIWWVDFKHVTKPFLPFIVLGANSILVYVLSGTIWHYLGEIPGGSLHGAVISLKDAIFERGFAGWLNPYNASLAMALAYVVLWTAIAGVLFRRKIFVRI